MARARLASDRTQSDLAPLAERAGGRDLVAPPHPIAERAQRFDDPLRLGFRLAGVGDEDVGQAVPSGPPTPRVPPCFARAIPSWNSLRWSRSRNAQCANCSMG